MRIFHFNYNFFGRQTLAQFKTPLLLATALVGAVLLSNFNQALPTLRLNNHSYPIYKVAATEKVAALTFDISWGNKIADPVLDILQEKEVKATFFLSGPWVRDTAEIPKRIAMEGHEIASHGQRHIDYDELSPEVIQQEVNTAAEILTAITGQMPHLIRTPNGAYNNQVIDTLDSLGLTAIQWSVDSLDWQKPGVQAIVSRVTANIHPGAIILMHASDSCPDTPEALPLVIDELREQGYKLMTVSELLAYGPGTI